LSREISITRWNAYIRIAYYMTLYRKGKHRISQAFLMSQLEYRVWELHTSFARLPREVFQGPYVNISYQMEGILEHVDFKTG
jgi:hypothetical protein